METVYLSLGSNEGDRRANMAAAIAELRKLEGVEVAALSGMYCTTPVGMKHNTAPFLNCVVELSTALDPLDLLDRLEEIELSLGRHSKGLYVDRAIDIDILLYGSHIVALPRLSVPHPRMAQRRFVLEPLAEIAPHVLHPVLKRTSSALNALTADQQVTREGPAHA